MTNSLTVAAVQLDCKPNDIEGNLHHSLGLIQRAKEQGAELVLLPELTPNGYLMTPELWSRAERFDGPSVSWLRETARSINAYVGMTFLEADGPDFFNTFVLASPSGKLHQRVRKAAPAGPEAFFFTAGDDPHYFDTELGRIGVGICYENFLARTIHEFFAAKVDLILQPFSAPTPRARFPLRKLDVRISDAAMRDQPAKTAEALGVPVVMANRCGAFVSAMPGRLPAWDTTFPGLSAVVDSDGVVKGQLGAREGVVTASVRLDPDRKRRSPPETYGKWSMPVPWWYSILTLIERKAVKAYSASHERHAAALRVSQPRGA